MPIQFACPNCQNKFTVKHELAGKVAKCVGCGKKLRVPTPKVQPEVKPVATASRTALDDILNDYEPEAKEKEPTLDIPPEIAAQLEAELENEKKKKRTADLTCPKCGAKFIGSTVVCVTCGYDTKMGDRVAKQQPLKTMLFSSTGRISRSTYWAHFALIVIVNIMFSTVLMAIAPTLGAEPPRLLFLAILIGSSIFGFSICLLIKRWHDRDKSGLWVFIGLVPLIGLIWTFVEAGCLPGTPGTNRYGSDPLSQKRLEEKKKAEKTNAKKT
ncbi:MAG: DUF805 domain-containing protein [Pirellulaceae bacterium]|nr:DUF805 domain-containing protein [Pirellulaceae bacterium]